MDGFSLKFVKLGKDRLQPDDHYTSDWVGGTGGNAAVIGVEGSFHVGVCGHLNNQGRPCALGLVSVLRKE